MKYSAKSKGTKTVNLAGGNAFQESPKLEFVSTLLTTFLKDSYYRKEEDTADRIVELIPQVGGLFAAKAAVYARTKFGMRSVSHLVAASIAKTVKGENWTKNFFDKIVYRPDDMMEILACYYKSGAKNEPNALKKGFAKALQRFDAYQIAKYKKSDAEVSLVDVVNLVHPAHTDAIAALVAGTLKPADTWETKLTQAGQKGESETEITELKGKAWADLLKEKKLGYFALLRNLRNITQQAPEMVKEACKMLEDEKLIKKSLVLPFRFLSAYKELESERGTSLILKSLSKALEISFQNIPKFEGKTLVVVDHSGSMGSGMDSYFGKAAIFGIAMAKANDSDFMHFGSYAKYLSFDPTNSTLSLSEWLDGQNSGKNAVEHGTDFYTIFEAANRKYDRIMIFSDMQGWERGGAPTEQVNAYKARFNADPLIYSIDIAGYGTMMFPERNVFCLAGWSDKIFDTMKFLETDKEALIKEVEAIIL